MLHVSSRQFVQLAARAGLVQKRDLQLDLPSARRSAASHARRAAQLHAAQLSCSSLTTHQVPRPCGVSAHSIGQPDPKRQRGWQCCFVLGEHALDVGRGLRGGGRSAHDGGRAAGLGRCAVAGAVAWAHGV